MTAHEKLMFGPFEGAVELRSDIARRALHTYHASVRLRTCIGILAALIGAVQIISRFASLPGSDWINEHDPAIMLSVGIACFFALANTWCCRQRYEDSQARLAAFLKRLPLSPADARHA
jgi:hypothetical protein